VLLFQPEFDLTIDRNFPKIEKQLMHNGSNGVSNGGYGQRWQQSSKEGCRSAGLP